MYLYTYPWYCAMHHIVNTKLFYISNYTAIWYKLETSVDGITERAIIRTLPYVDNTTLDQIGMAFDFAPLYKRSQGNATRQSEGN